MQLSAVFHFAKMFHFLLVLVMPKVVANGPKGRVQKIKMEI